MESQQLVTFILLPFIGVSAYLTLRHFSMWALNRRERLHLWVAAWCAGALTFQVGRLIQQHCTNPDHAHVAYLVYHGAVFIQFIFLNAISFDLDGSGRRRGLLTAMIIGNLTVTVLFVATPMSVTHEMYLRTDMLGVQYWEMQAAPGYWPSMMVWSIANFFYVFLTVWYADRLDRRVRQTILGSFLVYLAFGLNDVHFLGGIINTTSAFAFGFMAIAVAFDHMMILRLSILQNHLEEEVQERTQALTVATEEARAATVAKSEFLANMSHEIRTPMTAIVGFAESLSDPEVSESERSEMVSTIRRNGEHLLAVINDILDLSKVESGKFELEHANVSPQELVSVIASLLRPRALSKDLQLRVLYDGALPGLVCTDPTRLRQALLNLVSNAIKFTESGSVTVRTRYDADRQMLVMQVTDTGIGIPPDRLETIFAPFRQADTSTTRRFGGTGLGLTITRRFAELLGGRVAVRSTVGKGTTFTLEVSAPAVGGVASLTEPVHEAVGAPDASSPSVAPLAGLRVLLVEDGPDNRRLIMHILGKAGATVDAAGDGQAGLIKALEHRDAGTPYDVILMDMQMPVLDGYEATSELRRQGYTGPIIALTAHAMQGDRDRCLAVGCDDFASKPVKRAALIDMLVRWAQTPETQPAASGG